LLLSGRCFSNRIIAGPNGAGKSTFALEYLSVLAGCRNFVNADLIAAGLSPLPTLIFEQQGDDRRIINDTLYSLLLREAKS